MASNFPLEIINDVKYFFSSFHVATYLSRHAIDYFLIAQALVDTVNFDCRGEAVLLMTLNFARVCCVRS